MKATGRTTRLLEDAIRQAREGRAVYVIAATQTHARAMQHIAGEETIALGIKFETPETLGLAFDWWGMRISGSHPNCVFLVDHHTIETRFPHVLEMLHRYDLKTGPRLMVVGD